MHGTQHDRPIAGSIHAAIARELVRLLHEYTGRGPTRARTHISRDLITVVLEDTLTMGERSLVGDGKVTHVLDTRRAFQETMASPMVAAVERHSGRKVRAFLSANHIDPDIAVETFMLAPTDEAEAGDRGEGGGA